MNFDSNMSGEVSFQPIMQNEVIKKRRKRVKVIRKVDGKDVYDYIIMQTAIACGILLTLLVVNLVSTGNIAQFVSKLGF